MIQVYREQEIPAVIDSVLEIFSQHYDQEETETLRWRIGESVGVGLNSLVLTWSEDNRTAGFLFGFDFRPENWWAQQVSPFLPEGTDWFTNCFELNELAVHPNFQNRGFGRELLEALANDFPYRNTLLSVEQGNDSAIHLYEKLGFEVLKDDLALGGSPNRYLLMNRPGH